MSSNIGSDQRKVYGTELFPQTLTFFSELMQWTWHSLLLNLILGLSTA